MTERLGLPRAWTLYAGRRANRREGDAEFTAIGSHPRFTKAYGLEPIEVVAVEEPDGDYWGWIQRGKDVPVMVYDREGLFSMCFPYGYRAEVEADRGEVVRLHLSAATTWASPGVRSPVAPPAHLSTMTEISSSLAQPDIDLSETFAMATDIDARLQHLESWFIGEVLPAWTAFLIHGRSRHGLTAHLPGYSPADHRGIYEPQITGDGVLFTGNVYTSDGNRHDEFVVPADFVDPTTRPAAEARITDLMVAEKARAEAAARIQVEHRARKQRKQDEAEFARLAKALGKDI